jgi:hypothetical protein
MVNALLGIPTEVNTNVNVNTNYTRSGDDDGDGGDGSGGGDYRNRQRPMAAGGIVTQPTSALIGESGPEAVIPLDQLGTQSAEINRSDLEMLVRQMTRAIRDGMIQAQ